MDYPIKQVSVDKILPLRQRLLRPEKTLDETRFAHDKAKDSFHLALFLSDKIVGVATYIQDNSPQNPVENQYRLRGMAIAKKQQRQGLGELLFAEGLSLLKERGVSYLWFNAREEAIGFYKKQGCFTNGKRFVISDVGPHYFMFRNL